MSEVPTGEPIVRCRRGVEGLLPGERALVIFEDGSAELCITVTKQEVEFLYAHGFVGERIDSARKPATESPALRLL